MKLNKEFISRNINGECILVPVGSASFAGLIKGNKTMGDIIELLKEETTEEEIANKIFEKYDAPEDRIKADVAAVITKLREVGAIDE